MSAAIQSCLERSHYSSSCIYCVSSLLCHSPEMCQHVGHPGHMTWTRWTCRKWGRLIRIQKSLRKICKCNNKNCVLEKMSVRLCNIKDPSEEIKQIVFNYSTDSSHHLALTGFHHNITSSNLTHDLCHMSSFALFPIIPISLHHIDTLHMLKSNSAPSSIGNHNGNHNFMWHYSKRMYKVPYIETMKMYGSNVCFSYCQQILWKDQNQCPQQPDPTTSAVCVSKAWYIFFLCAIELHCCPTIIKNTSASHTVALGTCSFVECIFTIAVVPNLLCLRESPMRIAQVPLH